MEEVKELRKRRKNVGWIGLWGECYKIMQSCSRELGCKVQTIERYTNNQAWVYTLNFIASMAKHSYTCNNQNWNVEYSGIGRIVDRSLHTVKSRHEWYRSWLKKVRVKVGVWNWKVNWPMCMREGVSPAVCKHNTGLHIRSGNDTWLC